MLANDLSLIQLAALRGRPVFARAGERVGRLDGVLYDDDSGRAGWVLIRRGLFGRTVKLAPAGGAALRENGIRLPYPAALIEAAPKPRKRDPENSRIALYRHYHLTFPGQSYPTVPLPVRPERSEMKPAGAVTFRKWVGTSREHRKMPLEREVLRICRQPLYAPVDNVELGAQEVTITLFDEEPVVTRTVVAKERIIMEKDREQAWKKVPDPKKGEGDGSDEYRTPEGPAPEIGDPHDHNFAGRERHGDRRTA